MDEMNWEAVTVIIGVLGTIAVAIIKFAPAKKGSGMEMEPQQSQSLEQKIDRLQEDVNQIEVDVGILKSNSSRAEADVTGLRNELSALREMLTKYVLNKSQQ